MSTRRTTKSTKMQGSTLTDHFKPSRVGDSGLPGKSLGDEPSSTTSRAKRTLISSTRIEVTLDEVQVETIPVKTEKPDAKPRSARALQFGAVTKKVELNIKEEVKEKVVEPVRSIIPTEAEIEVAKSSDSRKTSVADLQACLKGAAKIHEQTNARKLFQIEERVAYLKSPQKMVQTKISGGSPPKKAKKESKKRAPVKVLPIPDFVLPTNSMEKAKNRPERETSEDREISPQEDSMTRAPKSYGSSLLNDEVKKSATVHLPVEYKELHKVFESCDTIVSMFKQKGQTLTFTDLSKEVKRIQRRDLTLGRFSQLLAVYPQAYKVDVKQITCTRERMSGLRAARWEHVIVPNLDDDLSSFVTGPLVSDLPLPSEPILTLSPRKNLFSPMKGRPITSSSGLRIPASPRKPSSPAKPMQREVIMDTRKRLEGWRMSCRSQVFRTLLARRVIAAHDKYVGERSLDSSFLSSSFSPSFGFHKDFAPNMDSLCPSIEKAEIGQIPEEETVSNHGHGMGEFIKMLSDTVTVLPKAVDVAIMEYRSPEKKTISSRGVPLSPAKFAQTSKPMSILERIKAKKAAEAAAEKRRNPELEEKMADLSRLIDQKIITLIFEIYRSESRTSINISMLKEKMVASRRISQDKVSSLLDRLTSLVPDHFSSGKTTVGEFLKVLPDNSPATLEIVESILKKELASCMDKSATSFRAP
ncbi:hypothetical protein PENTCL1PPCAC_26362 [Pristionchus entomophagus]|uniref:CDT1 Geminin-binding domain-containing protein n=1 Tax=Pristionchus entomophagus TaxID=358040 RepID=A0AAV5UBY5_9BILA|nr:hypothetical protein PENTCL1PPCAC_26362 [Pristionchus entomophagus]